MTTQNKIIIGLLILMVIVAVVWVVLDYQKTERQYQACLESCRIEHSVSGLEKLLSETLPKNYNVCVVGCSEKYGK